MTKDRLDRKTGKTSRGRPPSKELAAERAEREGGGRNWDARQVADLIDLSELTVKRMARRGKIPAVKVGRGWEFPPAKVRAWYTGEPVELPKRPPPKRRRSRARGKARPKRK